MATSREKVLQAASERGKYPLPQDCEVQGTVQEPNCGDVLTIGFKTRRMAITEIGFSLSESACPPLFACAVVMCRKALNQPVISAYVIKSADLAAELSTDGNLDAESVHCAMMVELAMKRAVIQFSQKTNEQRAAENAAPSP